MHHHLSKHGYDPKHATYFCPLWQPPPRLPRLCRGSEVRDQAGGGNRALPCLWHSPQTHRRDSGFERLHRHLASQPCGRWASGSLLPEGPGTFKKGFMEPPPILVALRVTAVQEPRTFISCRRLRCENDSLTLTRGCSRQHHE